MLSWLKGWGKKKEPTLSMVGHDLSTNPSPSAKQQRNAARIARLEHALKDAKGERRESLLNELKRRKGG